MSEYSYPSRRSRRAKKSRFDFLKKINVRDVYFLSKVAKYVFIGLVILTVLSPILLVFYSRELPKPGQLVAIQEKNSTRIYDRNGILLYSVYQDQNRVYTPLSDIPKNLQHATISIEDKDFYKNDGFSVLGMVRGVLGNLIRGQRAAGGSTISQQLVKNTLLSSERTITRKFKELILSIEINQKYSKDQILEMYLNNIPYGGTAIGVEAAAQQYFGKDSQDLDLAECAFLAGLPQSPSLYSPFNGKKYYIARAQSVLRQMVQNKYITQTQSDKALAEIKNFTFSQHDATGIKAPHFVMYVKELLEKQYGADAVETGGLQVYTTLDYNIEKKAEQIVKDEIDSLTAYKVGNGAAMVTNPKTGEILAMVGSRDYFDPKVGAFNVAVDGARQPGSSLKPIIYAKALEKGYTAASVYMDVKTDFWSGLPTDQHYTPVNYDGKFHGPVQMRFALANSFNIPAVKALAEVGIKDAMEKAYEMGINNWQPTEENLKDVGLSLVLGGRETTLYDEMTAYGTFANRGQRQDLYAIQKITDNKGNKLFEYKPHPGPQVISPEVAFIISHILLDNVARTPEFGPNSALRIPGRTVSVKTGTTDDKRDNWTMGYTPSYVVGVWVGNNDHSPMNQQIASGITGASPIWNQIMTAILKDKKDEQPYKPDDVIAMQIDALTGGLPVDGQPIRTEYFIKGTEPTTKSPIYQGDYLVFKEDDPVSKDGKNRWQEGIDAWIQQEHAGDSKYNPPDNIKNPQREEPTATPDPNASPTPTPSPSPTPTPTP